MSAGTNSSSVGELPAAWPNSGSQIVERMERPHERGRRYYNASRHVWYFFRYVSPIEARRSKQKRPRQSRGFSRSMFRVIGGRCDFIRFSAIEFADDVGANRPRSDLSR